MELNNRMELKRKRDEHTYPTQNTDQLLSANRMELNNRMELKRKRDEQKQETNLSTSETATQAYMRRHIEDCKKRKQEKTTLKDGDTVDISDILFTKTRDYLIKYKDHQLVNAKQLAGKVVVLHFVSLVNENNSWKTYTRDLLDIYDRLEPKGCFEVVFVAVRDSIPSVETGKSLSTYSTPLGRFEERFSTMPWTAIPFSDLRSRKRLENIFGISSDNCVDRVPVSFVIDQRGVVVQSHADHLFEMYGAAGYPFTKERIECLVSEDNAAELQLSVKTLLSSPERDYVITNKGEQVPIHKLEDKVVGLYLFQSNLNKSITRKLKKAYEELSKKMKDFEVVLINMLPILSETCEEDELCKTFETLPWLAIPFKDRDCSKKLKRILDHALCNLRTESDNKLVIIGPHGKFIEPFGAHILMRYGISAYPFTRFSAVNLMIENVKDVKPEMLWNQDAIFRQQNGSQVRFSQIVGKRIIVLFQNYYCGTSEHTLIKLKALYMQMKGTNDEFEVIQIHKGGEFKCVAGVIPWLTHPPFDTASDAGHLMARFFGGGSVGLVAFDCDGMIVRMTPGTSIGEMVFPFYEFDDMEDEVLLLVEDILGEPVECLLHYW